MKEHVNPTLTQSIHVYKLGQPGNCQTSINGESKSREKKLGQLENIEREKERRSSCGMKKSFYSSFPQLLSLSHPFCNLLV